MTTTVKGTTTLWPLLQRFDAWGISEGVLVLGLETRASRDIDAFVWTEKGYKFTGYSDAFDEMVDNLIAETRLFGLGLKRYRYSHLDLRSIAIKAGIGWRGRNSLVVHQKFGSRLRFAALAISQKMSTAQAMESQCNECRRCLDVCSTNALRDNGMLDQERCIANYQLDKPTPNAVRCALCAAVCPVSNVTYPMDEEASDALLIPE